MRFAQSSARRGSNAAFGPTESILVRAPRVPHRVAIHGKSRSSAVTLHVRRSYGTRADHRRIRTLEMSGRTDPDRWRSQIPGLPRRTAPAYKLRPPVRPRASNAVWRVLGLNQRRLSRRFYRPLPLTTRATRHAAGSLRQLAKCYPTARRAVADFPAKMVAPRHSIGSYPGGSGGHQAIRPSLQAGPRQDHRGRANVDRCDRQA
jgi:hypothetical protein